uniref:Uncharacterized protein n=1 Tax=Peronospora matthiolae TaxID=2874970 RepID=A0AAV1U2J9_9STRA
MESTVEMADTVLVKSSLCSMWWSLRWICFSLPSINRVWASYVWAFRYDRHEISPTSGVVYPEDFIITLISASVAMAFSSVLVTILSVVL